MKLANLGGRAVIVHGGRAADVQDCSDGEFGHDPMALLGQWSTFRPWAQRQGELGSRGSLARTVPFGLAELGPPVPTPGQVFAIGLNYRPHAAEAGFEPPRDPLVFTKFRSCLTGPSTVIGIPPGNVDWELELVVVMGTGGYEIAPACAWDAVAGVTVGQDLSERLVQSRGDPAQFSLGKSFPGFGPIGPWLVTTDELDDPDDLELTCTLSGEQVQHDRTSNLIFSVPELVSRLSAVCPLSPGDLIFTGTPGGVGNRRTPRRFIRPGDELVSEISGIGQMCHTFAARPQPASDVEGDQR